MNAGADDQVFDMGGEWHLGKTSGTADTAGPELVEIGQALS
jgi:hypothetical protein